MVFGRTARRRRDARRVAPVFAAAAFAVALAALCGSCADPARERFEGAEKALLEQRMDAALAGYRSIPRDFPHSRYAPAALLRQGDLFGSYFRNHAAAVEAYDSLVFNYPRAAEAPLASMRKGEILLLHFFNAPAAVETLEAVRQRHPDFDRGDEVLLLLGKAYGQMGDPARQVEVLSELVEKHPASPKAAEARWMIAFAHLAQGRFEEADREFRKILYLATERADIVRARWGMGQALEGMGDVAGALAQYEAIRGEWEDPEALAGKIARLKGRLRAARVDPPANRRAKGKGHGRRRR